MVWWLRISLPVQGTRVELWSGKIPRAVELLSLRTTNTVLRNERSHRNEKPAHHNEE